MGDTKIDWATKVWNPTTGCSKGCGYCYARRMAMRRMAPEWKGARRFDEVQCDAGHRQESKEMVHDYPYEDYCRLCGEYRATWFDPICLKCMDRSRKKWNGHKKFDERRYEGIVIPACFAVLERLTDVRH